MRYLCNQEKDIEILNAARNMTDEEFEKYIEELKALEKEKNEKNEEIISSNPFPINRKSEFIHHIIDLGQDANFVYNGKNCGIFSDVENYNFSFNLWYGEQTKEYRNIELETIMSDPFFDGKSINDLLDEISFNFV